MAPSPVSINSIKRTVTLWCFTHAKKSFNWFLLNCLASTAFIFISFMPSSTARSIPFKIRVSLSCPVMSLNILGFKLSILTLSASSPASANSSIFFNKLNPLVVMATFSMPGVFLQSFIISVTSFRKHGSPPVMRTFLVPSSANAFTSVLISFLFKKLRGVSH